MARFNIKYFHIFIYIGSECGILMFNSVMKYYTIYMENVEFWWNYGIW